MFLKIEETFWIKEDFFLSAPDEDEDVAAADVAAAAAVVPPTTVVVVVVVVLAVVDTPHSLLLTMAGLSSESADPIIKVDLLCCACGDEVIDVDDVDGGIRRLKSVVRFFLYFESCLCFFCPLVSLKLLLLGSFEVRTVILFCSCWISLCWDFDSLPFRTASPWEVASASTRARSLRIVLSRTRSRSPPEPLSNWVLRICTLSESEKHFPKICCQSTPKNLTLGSRDGSLSMSAVSEVIR